MMFMSKELIESVLSEDLVKSFDQCNFESLDKISQNLQENMNKTVNDINEMAKANMKELKPEINKSESFISKINSLQNQIDIVKSDLDSQENLLKNASEIDEYKKLIEHIEVINNIILAIQSFKKFEAHLNDFKESIDNKNYTVCCLSFEKLNKINEECEFFSKNYDSTSPNEILVVKELKQDFTVQRERLWYELDTEWDRLLKIEINESYTKIILNNALTQNYLNELTQFSKFKDSYNNESTSTNFPSFVFLSRMKQFCKKFLQFCEKHILIGVNEVNSSFYEATITKDSKNETVELTFDKINFKSNNDNCKILEFKLKQILAVITFLYEHFFKFEVNEFAKPKPAESSKTKYDKSKSKTIDGKKVKLINVFSDLILDDFVKLIYQQLIISIIPLKNYNYNLEAEICEKVSEFERELKQIDFIDYESSSSKSSVFKIFINNVEELYVRKKCKSIMESAREIMKNKEYLFEFVRIEEENFTLKTPATKSDSEYVNLLNKLLKIDQDNDKKTKLDEINLLVAPTCSISRIAEKLIKIIYSTLNEALKMTKTISNEDSSLKNVRNVSLLCLTARNLFDLYSAVVPLYHSESLTSLPKLAATIFNDFKYLAFNCLTITHQYKELFLDIKQKVNQDDVTPTVNDNIEMNDMLEIISNFSCLDLIPELCAAGHEILAKQIKMQQNNLIQFLNEDTNGINNISESNNYDLFNKALKKCIIQLNNLSSSWINIFSQNDYYKIFGQFFQLICNDLLKSVLKLEDISSDDASYLNSAFVLINQCVYELMSMPTTRNSEKNNDDIKSENNASTENQTSNLKDLTNRNQIADFTAAKYIKSWERFKYLLVLLKASLAEIVDLWSDNKGPLALHYNSEEIRHLIRALFMNTDRRSDALAKIK